jgi:hypothetical protein
MAPPAPTPAEAVLGYLVNAANDQPQAASKFADPRLTTTTYFYNWASGAGSEEDSVRVIATSPVAAGGAALVTVSAVTCQRDRFGGRACDTGSFLALVPAVQVGGHWYVNGFPFAPDQRGKRYPDASRLSFDAAVAAASCTGTPPACTTVLTYDRPAAYTSAAAAQSFVFADQTQRFACLPQSLGGSGRELTLTVTCPAAVRAGDLVRVRYNAFGREYVYDAGSPTRAASNQAAFDEFNSTIAT